MIQKKLFLSFIIIFLGIRAFGQIAPLPTDVPNILPPSPTAADLGKFALMGDDLVTGGAKTHIDIYKYATKNLSLPISLDYSSDGIKVDQVATRVGLGWTLNAGGCISRTVVGLADDASGYLAPPSDWPNTTGSTLKTYLDGVTSGALDTQPDIYSFNFAGYSGRFTLINGNVTKLEENNLNISGSVQTGFIVITPDGVKYTFTAQESTQSINSAHPIAIINAWFLTRIEHPKGDVIMLTYNSCQYTYLASANMTDVYYDSGISSLGSYTPPNEAPTNKKTSIVISNQSVYLTEVSSNSGTGGYLKFIYGARQDMPGDYSLNLITLYNKENPAPTDLAIKSVEFGYYYATANNTYANEYSTTSNNTNQRLFLTNLVDNDKSYQFTYNDIDNLPPRLSYSQDDFGYFNGKINNSMIPTPFGSQYIAAFSSYGFGDRTPDWNFSQKGLLTKIIFPTGGNQTIDYEPNSVYQITNQDCSSAGTPVNVLLTGDSYLKNNNIYTTASFHVSCLQQVQFDLSLSLPANITTPDPLGEDLVQAALVPAGTSFNNLSSSSFTLMDINNFQVQAVMGQSNVFNVVLSPGDYELAILVRGNSHAFCSFSYQNGVLNSTNNKQVAGVRVKRITSYDQASNHNSIKRYYYDDLSSGQSTGQVFNANPVYKSTFKTYTNLYTLLGSPPAGDCDNMVRNYTKLSSSNYYGISNLTGNHIYYNKVTESNGENFEEGGIEHDFSNSNDSWPLMLQGLPIGGAPLCNSGINSHKEVQKSTFYKNGTNYITVNKVITNYYNDPRLSLANNYYVFNAASGGKTLPCIAVPYYLSEFIYLDVTQYYLYSRWTYPSSIKSIQYDHNGLNPATTIDSFIYDNPAHQQISTEQTINSKGETYTKNNLYPPDVISGLSSNALAAQANLVNKNIISPVLVQQINKNGTLLHTTKVNYFTWPNTLILPQSIETQYGSAPSETRVNFNNYDNNGNIREQQKTGGPTQAVLWDYANMYVIAEASNANFNDIAYTSFEADSSGNWTIPSATRDATTAVTGNTSYNLANGAITKTGLTGTTSYIVSYWLKSSTPLSITGTITGYPKTGRSYNGWTCFEHQITGQSAITLSGSSNIDEIRLYPVNAHMTTYTYQPLIGISTVNDDKNNINYYEYDGFNHLKNIKDQNGYIIKSFDYNYAATQVNYGANLIYSNVAQSGSFTKSCSTGSYGTMVNYSIQAGLYKSLISQGDADSQAITALNTNGQNNANATGTCVVCDLSNPANKMINGACETGNLIYTASAKQTNGKYICTYHYEWSDGTHSQNYQTALSVNPCVNLN